MGPSDSASSSVPASVSAPASASSSGSASIIGSVPAPQDSSTQMADTSDSQSSEFPPQRTVIAEEPQRATTSTKRETFTSAMLPTLIGGIFTALVLFTLTTTNSRIDRLEDKMDTKIGELEDKMDTKISELDTKIGELEDKMDTKISELDTKIGEVQGTLNTLIAVLEVQSRIPDDLIEQPSIPES